MRTLLLALLIALLPLRGWMGDAMALEPVHAAGMQQSATEAPCPEHGTMVMGEHSMDDMTMAAADNSDDSAISHDLNCNDCKVCQLCHGTVLSLLPLSLQVAPLPRSAPQSTQPHLSSVALTPAHKPPIL